MNYSKTNTHDLALMGLMAAVTCILGPLSIPIPFSVVPISFTNLAIYLSVFVLGWKKGTASYLVYLLLGMAGVPVFSGFSGGIGKIVGPTGGYLVGFLFLAVISGLFIEKFSTKTMQALGMLLGLAVTYLFGTAWLSFQLQLTFQKGLLLGVLPYLPGDIIKIAAVLILGPVLKKSVARFKG